MSKRKIFHFLEFIFAGHSVFFLGEGSCCKNRKSFINEEQLSWRADILYLGGN